MEAGSPQRVPIAVASFLILATVVALVLLTRSGGAENEAAAAPPECVKQWNFDPAALSFGQHNYVSHGYNRVRVLLLDRQADEAAEGSTGGFCAVAFPARTLDPEPVAAGMIRVQGTWMSIKSLPGVTTERLAELQSEAVPAVNADLGPDGKVVPF